VVEAEVGMLAGAGSAALAAVGKGEAAQGHAVLIECGRRAANRAKRGHGWLQKVSWDYGLRAGPSKLRVNRRSKKKSLARGEAEY